MCIRAVIVHQVLHSYCCYQYSTSGTRFPFEMLLTSIPGVRQVEKGEHRRSYDMCMSVARLAGVAPLMMLFVPLLYCANAFEIQRNCGLKLSPVLFKMARPHDTHTRTHTRAPFVAVANQYLEVRLLSYRGGHSFKTLRYDRGTEQQHQTAAW